MHMKKTTSRNARLATVATVATVALLMSFAIMILLHAHGSHPSFMLQSSQSGMHPMSAMWNEMGWRMALGPIAMLLFFGGILTLIVLFVRSFSGGEKN